MSASLVGSEMCIRDSSEVPRGSAASSASASRRKLGYESPRASAGADLGRSLSCLLYTSPSPRD
eukprot:6344806-Alexandrium_andersonii.AAC.1